MNQIKMMMHTIFRSRAPLRIGLAGGGTDVSPYTDEFGGAILNATISHYAHTTIEVIPEQKIIIHAADRNETETHDLQAILPLTGCLDLHKGVFNRICKDYGVISTGLRITSYVDAPAGSGLGTSSTLMVAIIGAFTEMLQLPMGEYDIAHYAYQIERKDLQLAGGRQDQYAATFGGVNFMEFYAEDKVIVNPLRIRNEYLHELENNLVLFFTSNTRESAAIIKEQQKNVNDKNKNSIDAMHQLKEQAFRMKEALLKGRLHEIGEILNYGFEQKRKMAANISNQLIEEIYAAAQNAGATGGKISGAGGGGFMIFYCPSNSRYSVMQALDNFGGHVKPYQFTKSGLTTWAV